MTGVPLLVGVCRTHWKTLTGWRVSTDNNKSPIQSLSVFVSDEKLTP
jgi:hypothetical protein